MEELEKLANQGDAKAQFNLGLLYYDGDEVSQNYNKAFYWFGKAAEQGDVGAQLYLGFMYYAGDGVVQDDKNAVFISTVLASTEDIWKKELRGYREPTMVLYRGSTRSG